MLFTGEFLRLVREGHWEYVDRVNASGAAIIVAVTDQKKLILVEQERIPLHARTIELPAGLTGDGPEAQESQMQAARRELMEETGYAAERLELLTAGPACSGLTSEIVSFFRACGLKRLGNGGGVEHEDIRVHEVPVGEVEAWLEARRQAGVFIDPKIYSGLYFLGRE